jgi:hypothetical protein
MEEHKMVFKKYKLELEELLEADDDYYMDEMEDEPED